MKIDKKYRWLARDKDGQLCAFVSDPSKNKGQAHWNNTSGFGWSKIKEEDGRFSFIKWEDEHGVKISDIVDYFDSDSKEEYTSGNEDNPLGISAEEAMEMINKYNPDDSNDVISKPSHYIGINGLEVEQILAEFLPRFTDGYEAHRVGSAIEYLLRSPLKNKGEDIEKAGQNIEQIKRYNQGKQA